MLNRTYCVISVAALICLVPLACCQKRTPDCLNAFYDCSESEKSNCSISNFHSLLSLTAQSLMVDRISMRLHADALKKDWKDRSGYCYIEAIVSSDGRVLFLRFSNSRSLLTGFVDSASWKKLQNLIQVYESRPNGMQLLVDLNAKQHCSNSNFLSPSVIRDTTYVFARLMNRSEVNELPTTSSYINMDFSASAEEIKQVQKSNSVNLHGSKSLDVATILLNKRWHPLTLWVYRCPARLGFGDVQCNSKMHAYLFLRSWINNSRAQIQKEDFKNYAGWRYKFLKEDVYLITLMVIVPLYIAIHLHCIMWFGLSPVSSGL
ncbi:hypothetical protein BOX15_Mlig015509g2 [Macrostomum lignano]|uniref:Uncharacterized protein n=1 Tax=Macrostomum lignano TaxID=282301 RepID=A0A267GY87_9PLAT|nr:hypothetical protein BOX15_Mlig015509g2 [Macrostomum lignano]